MSVDPLTFARVACTAQATSNALAESGVIGQAMTHYANKSSGEIEDSLHGEPAAVLMNRVTNVCSEKKSLEMLVSSYISPPCACVL